VAIRSRPSSLERRDATKRCGVPLPLTPRRTGLLVYVSGWEGKVELIPDVGLEARIPRALWGKAAQNFAHDDLDHFLAGLAAVGELLAEHVPHTDGQRVDLANTPRIRA
jgi:uncharacterized membrane protein